MQEAQDAAAQERASPAPPRGYRARRLSHRRMREERAKSASLAIASSLFLVLVAAALLFGGNAFIGPLLQAAADAREAKGTGDVIYTMPDGIFCRHMSFNNGTAEITRNAIEPCPSDVVRHRRYTAPTFAWGAR